MDNQDFARLDTLSEKAFNETISPYELKEYLHLLDEWEILNEQNPVGSQVSCVVDLWNLNFNVSSVNSSGFSNGWLGLGVT